MRTINLLRAVLAAITSLTTIDASAVRSAPLDDVVLNASDAFQKKDAARLARLVEPARGHVLGQYVEYWSLRMSLDGRSAAAVRDFLARNKGDYVAERLRAEWLRALGRRGQWEDFQAELAAFGGRDTEITCYAILARHRGGAAASIEAFRPIWRTPTDLPEGCVLLVERFSQEGLLTAEFVWERGRALAELGQTGGMLRRALAYLPFKESVTPGAIDQAIANPAGLLSANGRLLSTRSGRELYALALGRLSRRDPVRAAGHFTADIQARFPDAERANAFAQIALHAARNHQVEALDWYGKTDNGALSEEQLAWRVRTALRAGEWSHVARAVDLMGPEQKADATWVYWRARALREFGQTQAADALFAKIAGQHHFYGNLAAEEIGVPFELPPQSVATTPEELVSIEQNAGLQRALALFRLQMRDDGMKEWVFSTRGLPDRALLAAAELARRHKVWDRVISTADRTRVEHDFYLRYVAPYREIFTAHSNLLGLEESWVLGITRQESRFIVDAKSSAGASGLMQLMPDTARLVAQRIGMKKFTMSRINEPQINIQLGASFLRFVLDDLDGNPLLASAAYNAGPRRAQQWRAATALEGAIYAESIPFNETRNYVKRVLSNTMYYARLQGGEAGSLKARLGTVRPRPAAGAMAKAESGS